ncbi:MAG TPA: efflux RND transporter periplasmic adaptor subunit [Xanthomonadaceae bacterium]|nr:efflux RND transporter periplasmic adaptor subunit [Xanthomonadaceae bacterium]
MPAGLLLVVGAAVVAGWLIAHRQSPVPVVAAHAAPAASAPEVPAAGSLLDASGYVVAARRATVSSETTGRLTEVRVREGDLVSAGQVLARLDPHEVDQQVKLSAAELDAARRVSEQRDVELQAALDRFQRLRRLAEQHYVSEDAYKAAEYEVRRMRAQRAATAGQIAVAARQLAVQRQRQKNMEVVAPFDGMVTELAAQVGEIVSPISAGGGFTRTGICTLVDMASIQVRVNVNEKHIGRVHPGQMVTMVPRAFPELRLRGRVATIMPVAQRETASVEVIIDFLERDRRVLPNMSIDVSFAGDGDGTLEQRPLAATQEVAG